MFEDKLDPPSDSLSLSIGFNETEDLNRVDYDEDSTPHLNEGDDLDSMEDDLVLIFNEPDYYEDES